MPVWEAENKECFFPNHRLLFHKLLICIHRLLCYFPPTLKFSTSVEMNCKVSYFVDSLQKMGLTAEKEGKGWAFVLVVKMLLSQEGLPDFDTSGFWLLAPTPCWCRPWEAVMMAQIVGFLPPWIEFPDTSFGSVAVRESTDGREYFSLSLLLSPSPTPVSPFLLSASQVNKYL